MTCIYMAYIVMGTWMMTAACSYDLHRNDIYSCCSYMYGVCRCGLRSYGFTCTRDQVFNFTDDQDAALKAKGLGFFAEKIASIVTEQTAKQASDCRYTDMASIYMAYIGIAHTVMVYTVMTYIGTACVVIAYTILAYIVMAHVVMAYVVLAYIVMAHVVMAHVVMAAKQAGRCSYGLCRYGLCSYGSEAGQPGSGAGR